MKTPRFQISIVMAAAIGTIVLIVSSTHASPLKGFARLRSSERGEPRLASSNIETGEVHHPAPPVPLPPGYPRYRLVDLGTLGGPNSGHVEAAVTLNNRGDVIAIASTATLDPYPFTIQDEFIWHGILSNRNGIMRDLGALPGVNQSLPVWISDRGWIVGMSENGLWDDTADFPQLRPVLWDTARNIHDLGTFGGNTGWATAVNNSGQVAGYATNTTPEDPDVASFMNGFLPAGQQVRAFVWNGGSLRDLGTLGGNDAAA
jgi:hypothetical protein